MAFQKRHWGWSRVLEQYPSFRIGIQMISLMHLGYKITTADKFLTLIFAKMYFCLLKP
jgi:hypothetical protein